MGVWQRRVLGSLTRISDLADRPWDVAPRARSEWSMGDYVVCEVNRVPQADRRIELADGRMAGIALGDHVVGALGDRFATLEAVGSWRDVGDDGLVHVMTAAGLMGRITSRAPAMGPAISSRYVGHVVRDGTTVTMHDFVPEPRSTLYDVPTVLLVGTSMACGKTTAARVIVHALKERGIHVVGAKLTGAGRYRDILAMKDAGADHVLDFVDVGLPSTVVEPAFFAERLDLLLAMIADQQPQVAVVEAGASPLEPYNGDLAVERISARVALTVLCASDPYAVTGIEQTFGHPVDVVSGFAASTAAGEELVGRLSGHAAVNVLARDVGPRLDDLIDRHFPDVVATDSRSVAWA